MRFNLTTRISEVDGIVGETALDLAGIEPGAVNLARELSSSFELPYGTLLRRAAACQRDGGDIFSAMREAASHLIVRRGD